MSRTIGSKNVQIVPSLEMGRLAKDMAKRATAVTAAVNKDGAKFTFTAEVNKRGGVDFTSRWYYAFQDDGVGKGSFRPDQFSPSGKNLLLADTNVDKAPKSKYKFKTQRPPSSRFKDAYGLSSSQGYRASVGVWLKGIAPRNYTDAIFDDVLFDNLLEAYLLEYSMNRLDRAWDNKNIKTEHVEITYNFGIKRF